jgi:hypothetical protein
MARCPMCGVIFPHRANKRAESKHKCCSAPCTGLAMEGKKPLCTPDEIETLTITLSEYRERQAAMLQQRYEMRMAGLQASQNIVINPGHRALYQDRECAQCGKTFRILHSRVKQGSGKYCNKKCFTAAQKAGVIEREKKIVAALPQFEARDGKESFTNLAYFEAAIGRLMARGYSFIVKGRAFDVRPPQSDFYGLQWGMDYHAESLVFFYTTRQNVFKNYASR